jgi:hypothetical protein
VHAYLGSFSPINFPLSTNRNHISQITPNPCHSLLSLKPLKTVHTLSSPTDLHNPFPHSIRYHHFHFTMKFKTDTSASSEKKVVAQRGTGSSAPKMVKPLNNVPPTKSMKKTAEKSSSKKKKTTKKGESKQAES